jgi:hypothetical protein
MCAHTKAHSHTRVHTRTHISAHKHCMHSAHAYTHTQSHIKPRLLVMSATLGGGLAEGVQELMTSCQEEGAAAAPDGGDGRQVRRGGCMEEPCEEQGTEGDRVCRKLGDAGFDVDGFAAVHRCVLEHLTARGATPRLAPPPTPQCQTVPVVVSEGRSFPVTTVYLGAPGEAPESRLRGRRLLLGCSGNGARSYLSRAADPHPFPPSCT